MMSAEYHARQRANDAQNRASSQAVETASVRSKLRIVEQHLTTALAALSEQADPAARSELERAVEIVRKLRR
jgi:hypothetical protein